MGHLAFPPGVPCFVQCIFPFSLPARHQRLPRTAARPASAERRRGQLRRGHRLSATPHPPGNGKAGRARPGPGIGRRPATGLGPRFRLCRPTAQDQRQRAHRIPRRRPVQATDRQRDPATGRTRPTLSRRPAPGHLARVLRTLTLPCRPERGGSRDHFPPAAQPPVRPSWRTPAAPVRRTPELTRPTAGESIRRLAEQSAGNQVAIPTLATSWSARLSSATPESTSSSTCGSTCWTLCR